MAATKPLTPHPLQEDADAGLSDRAVSSPAASRPPPRTAELEVPPPPLGLVALHDLWKKTRGSLSLDLKRRQWKGGMPGRDSLWRVSSTAAEPGAAGRRRRGRPPAYAQPTYYSQQPQPGYGAYGAPGRGGGGYGSGGGGGSYGGGGGYRGGGAFVELPSLSFMDTGARIKVMRHVQFGPKVEVARSSGLRHEVPAVDLGVGLAFELDTAELQPQARLKFRDVASLRALPYPALKVQKRLAVGDSSWGVRLSYECPLEGLPTFWRPPARLMLSIDNMRDNGVQLTQAGLEFNYAADLLGGSTYLRAQGLVALPRELPVEEGQPFAALELKRLGLKWAW